MGYIALDPNINPKSKGAEAPGTHLRLRWSMWSLLFTRPIAAGSVWVHEIVGDPARPEEEGED